MSCCITERPSPPYCTGQAGATHFFVASRLANSRYTFQVCGSRSREKRSPTQLSGRLSFSQSRTSWRKASSSGVKRKSMGIAVQPGLTAVTIP